MKRIIILGDGMADHAVESLGGKTLLQHAHTPYMDLLARKGRCGRLITVPEGYLPGSEVANTAILGYDLDVVYEGRGLDSSLHRLRNAAWRPRLALQYHYRGRWRHRYS